MLTTLNQETLQALRDNGARESVELDFKSDFNPDNADHRRGLIEDVCAWQTRAAAGCSWAQRRMPTA